MYTEERRSKARCSVTFALGAAKVALGVDGVAEHQTREEVEHEVRKKRSHGVHLGDPEVVAEQLARDALCDVVLVPSHGAQLHEVAHVDAAGAELLSHPLHVPLEGAVRGVDRLVGASAHDDRRPGREHLAPEKLLHQHEVPLLKHVLRGVERHEQLHRGKAVQQPGPLHNRRRVLQIRLIGVDIAHTAVKLRVCVRETPDVLGVALHGERHHVQPLAAGAADRGEPKGRIGVDNDDGGHAAIALCSLRAASAVSAVFSRHPSPLSAASTPSLFHLHHLRSLRTEPPPYPRAHVMQPPAFPGPARRRGTEGGGGMAGWTEVVKSSSWVPTLVVPG